MLYIKLRIKGIVWHIIFHALHADLREFSSAGGFMQTLGECCESFRTQNISV